MVYFKSSPSSKWQSREYLDIATLVAYDSDRGNVENTVIIADFYDFRYLHHFDTQFVEYAGIHIDDAKQLCVRENLDFNEEFWEPFLKFLNL